MNWDLSELINALKHSEKIVVYVPYRERRAMDFDMEHCIKFHLKEECHNEGLFKEFKELLEKAENEIIR